jgi:diguanylate cyclase (GGDEF)-like protein
MANEIHTEPVYSVGHVNEYALERDAHSPGHHQPSPYPRSEPPQVQHSVADVASILGLPDAAVTPAVLKAVTGLLGEADRLRWLDSQTRRRQAFLEGLADHDAVVPALNRRGFMRELEGLLSTGHGAGTLVLLHVAGIEHLRQVEGLAAGDGALRHVTAHLVGSLRSSDPVGLMGGSDFALLLSGTELAAAREKVRDVMERINQQPFYWQGEVHSFALFSGYHVLQPGENAESAIAAADRARRGLPG